jgi:hypothetical protein
MHGVSRPGIASYFLVVSLALGLVSVLSATEGTFEGRIVDPAPAQSLPQGWIFVQGRNQMLRRVEITHATVVFGQQVPSDQRRKCGPDCLEPGQEVRVTAIQDSAGEWRAKRVEILRLADPGALGRRGPSPRA